MPPLLRRALRIALAAVAAGALVYWLAMNAFIRTRLFRDVIGSDPGSLLVEYSGAYSLVPGRIHVENLLIRGRDSSVEWVLTIDRCDFDVSFRDLARKRFHASHVRGDGLSLRLRRRRDAIPPGDLPALPPVPGFLDPPLTDVGPPLAPLTDANYNLWSIQLDDVEARNVREIWIDTIRHQGDLEIHGRWFFRPLRWLDVGPATIDARALDVGRGQLEPWFSGGAGWARVTVHPFDLQAVHGASMIDRMSLVGDLHGTARIANALRPALTKANASVERADAPLRVHVDVDHGVVGPATSIASEPFSALARVDGLAVRASVTADARVDPDHRGRATVRCDGASVSRGDVGMARAASIVLLLTSRELDLAHPFSDASYALQVDDAETESLRRWRARMPGRDRVTVDSAVVRASGRVEGEVARANAEGRVDVDVHGLVLARAGQRLEASASGSLRLAASLRERRVDLSGSTATLRDVRATHHGAAMLLRSVTARADDVVLGAAGPRGRLAVDAPAIELPSLAAWHAALALPPSIAIEAGSAMASARIELDLAAVAATGEVRLAARDVRVRVGSATMRGTLTGLAHARRRGTVTDLTGSTVAFRVDAAAPDSWWGALVLPRAELAVLGGARLRARIVAQAKDASPLAALVADKTVIPRWAVDALTRQGLQASGEIVLASRTIEARSVTARTEGVDLRFELARLGEQQEWALLVASGALRLGVDVADGYTDVLLIGAEPWFERKAASLHEVERRHRE